MINLPFPTIPEPPPAPRDVRVRDVTNQTLTLSWSPPPAGGPPQYDTHYTVSYGGEGSNSPNTNRREVFLQIVCPRVVYLCAYNPGVFGTLRIILRLRAGFDHSIQLN